MTAPYPDAENPSTAPSDRGTDPPEFVRRLAGDPLLARNAAYATLVLTYLESAGLAAGGGALAERIEAVVRANGHLLAFFEDRAARERLAEADRDAVDDLAAWARAQHLEREEPQVAYELGLLALGVTLPPVLVRSLRELPLTPDTTVAELPNGSGYPTIFLATLHPDWPAAERATLLVTSTDARQLAAWATLLLTQDLERSSRVVVVGGTAPRDDAVTFDYAISYHVPPGLAAERLVRARQVIVV